MYEVKEVWQNLWSLSTPKEIKLKYVFMYDFFVLVFMYEL